MKPVHALSLVSLVNAAVIDRLRLQDTKPSQICIETQTKECYPWLFEGTHEWRTIRQDQELPAGRLVLGGCLSMLTRIGLYVKVNIDTELLEAKLLKESELAKSLKNPELTSLLEVIENHQTTRPAQLSIALEALAEMGHDSELGLKISQPSNIINLLAIIQNKAGIHSASSRELAARTIGTSLQNNQKAIDQSTRSDTKILEALLKCIDDIVLYSVVPISTDVQKNRLVGSLVYAIS